MINIPIWVFSILIILAAPVAITLVLTLIILLIAFTSDLVDRILEAKDE